MSSQFDGMSRREMDGMPMVGEATGIQLSQLLPRRRYVIHPMLARVSLRQERYVREVYMRCPRWRFRKRRLLRGALDHATLVADINCRQVLNLPPVKPEQVGGSGG